MKRRENEISKPYGRITSIEETDDGLEVRGVLDRPLPKVRYDPELLEKTKLGPPWWVFLIVYVFVALFIYALYCVLTGRVG